MRGNLNTFRSPAVPARPVRQGKRRSRKNRRLHLTSREARAMILRGSLPPGTVICGSLNFYEGSNPIFPPGVRIKGNLLLFYCGEKTRLSTGMTIDGVADFTGSRLTSLPKRMKVGANLDVSQTLIQVLPLSLKVGLILQVDERASKSMRARAAQQAREKGYPYPPKKRFHRFSRRQFIHALSSSPIPI